MTATLKLRDENGNVYEIPTMANGSVVEIYDWKEIV